MQFSTVVMDPPWAFTDSLPGPGRGAAKQYNLLSPVGIINTYQEVMSYTTSDSRLFLWRVASMQSEALYVMEELGYTLKAEMVWIKKRPSGSLWFGMGRQVRNSHEICLIGTRGHPERLSASVRSVFEAPVTRHSEKPERFYQLVEELSPGPYLELFARKRREGWTCIGNQLT